MTQNAQKTLLPFMGGPEDVDKVVQFLKTRPTGATEGDLGRTLGIKYADPRRFDLYDLLGLFKRLGGVFRLTDRGLEYLRSDEDKKQRIYRDAIRTFEPYNAILDWAFHNHIQLLDADTIKHEWANKFDGTLDFTNKNRLETGPTVAFSIIQAAGLGTYVLGRRGAKSRIEFNLRALEEYVSNDTTADASGPILQTPPPSDPVQSNQRLRNQQQIPSEELTVHTFTIPVLGKVAKIVWPDSTMSSAEWERLKKVGDAMFLD